MCKKLLIVDDDDSFAFNCVKKLNNRNLSLSTADSPENAKLLIKYNDFDYILLNARIPGGDTLNLKRELKSISPKSFFLFMSSIDDDYKKIVESGEECLKKYDVLQTIQPYFA